MGHLRLTLYILLMALPFSLEAQNARESYDIMTYEPPVGWETNVNDDATWYQVTDKSTGAWCQLGIFKSVRSTGDPVLDYNNEWKALVNPATYVGASKPTPTTETQEGWTLSSGASKFTWEGKEATIMLFNRSGYGVTVSTIVTMSNERFYKDVLKVVGSMQVQKMTEQAQQPSQTIAANSEFPPIAVTDAAGVHGIATSTTNFNDGWTAQPFADYVKVTKGPVTVLLHYAFQVDDQMRNGDMGFILWNRLIVPRYETGLLQIYENEPYTYNKIYFVEGQAVERSTGKGCYVGLRVLVANGIARCIEIISPSQQEYERTLPDQEKVAAMTGYNKFFVVASDIVGTWQESTSSGIDMYNSVTGTYAGMNTSASANTFTFKSDGTYDSNHKGAYGMTGNLKFYDQKYNGKYTMGNWDVTMTNRFEGKTDVYFCEYEAVRGGRILKLNDKSAPAVWYNLVRVK